MTNVPTPFHKVFNNVDLANQSTLKDNCSGQKCNDCRICYNFDTENIIIELEKDAQKELKKKRVA